MEAYHNSTTQMRTPQSLSGIRLTLSITLVRVKVPPQVSARASLPSLKKRGQTQNLRLFTLSQWVLETQGLRSAQESNPRCNLEKTIKCICQAIMSITASSTQVSMQTILLTSTTQTCLTKCYRRTRASLWTSLSLLLKVRIAKAILTFAKVRKVPSLILSRANLRFQIRIHCSSSRCTLGRQRHLTPRQFILLQVLRLGLCIANRTLAPCSLEAITLRTCTIMTCTITGRTRAWLSTRISLAHLSKAVSTCDLPQRSDISNITRTSSWRSTARTRS